MKKKLINQADFSFRAISVNESFARYTVASFCAQLDPTLEELTDLRTAVSEAVTNAIVHGYRGVKDGIVYITVKAFSDRSISIKIRDKGCGIADIRRAMTPLFTTDPEGERGGMGFSIMESFTDDLTVRSFIGRGTTVIMEKRLSDDR
ncbi:MAG: anti-sigma F factor [Clostridia bacterium]|nr:anti-sigma F factor [Clostridia bacterium]